MEIYLICKCVCMFMKTIKAKMILDLYESHCKPLENEGNLCVCVRASKYESKGEGKKNKMLFKSTHSQSIESLSHLNIKSIFKYHSANGSN